MDENLDYREMTAPCGLDCFNCPFYLANEDGELRAALSRRRGISYERAVCRGCRGEGGTIAALEMTGPCGLYRCISERGYDFCCDCPDFPCDHLHPYADKAAVAAHNTKVFNLCLMRRMGLESWARTRAAGVGETYFEGKLKL